MTTQIEVKERPIIMQPESIRAILEGRKTQTRRVVKLPPFEPTDSGLGMHIITHNINSPYGKPFDRLWVRETFWYQDWLNLPSSESQPIHYSADGNTHCLEDYKQKPSIFMPRWASRITLEITDVRVERLQDISYADVLAEGTPTLIGFNSPRKFQFEQLWESINGKKYPWSTNPFVWVVEFRRVMP